MKRAIQKALAALANLLHRQELAATVHRLEQRGLLHFGRHTYGIPNVTMYRGSECRITIGSFCSIAPGVQVVAGGIHPDDWVSLYPFRIMWQMDGAFRDGMPRTRGDIVIGSDVWLGTEVMILSGVTIGHGSIVAARSVVTRDVPPYSIVAGAPARIVRRRFADDTVAKLLTIAWWDWDDAEIRAVVDMLSSSQIEAFLQYCNLRKGRP
jgi:chloramphenicol O-acetyltransferase type B